MLRADFAEVCLPLNLTTNTRRRGARCGRHRLCQSKIRGKSNDPVDFPIKRVASFRLEDRGATTAPELTRYRGLNFESWYWQISSCLALHSA
jgi:hypothetical protein